MSNSRCHSIVLFCALCLSELLTPRASWGAAHIPEQSLKEALAQDGIDPHQILQALLGEAGRFRSGENEPDGFTVELIGLDIDGTEIRLIGDYSESGIRSLETHGRMTATLRHDQQMLRMLNKKYSLTEEGAVQVEWANVRSMSHGDPIGPCRIDASIAGMLTRLEGWNSVEFDTGLSQLRASNSAGETLIVSLRTPDDAERHGSLISHASVWRDGTRIRELRRPARGTSSQRFPPFRLPQMQEWNALQELPPKDQPGLKDWFDHGANAEPILRAKSPSSLEAFFALGSVTRMQNGEFLPDPLSEGGKAVEATLLGVDPAFPRIVNTFVGSSNKMTSPESDSPLNDDMVIRSWDLERSSSFAFVRLFMSNHVTILSKRGDVELAIRVRNASALGNMGRPMTFSIPTMDCVNHDLLEAILWSRWEFPCSQAHIDTCLDACKSMPMSNGLCAASVESLIRINRFDLVPVVLRDEWWANQVLRFKAKVSVEPAQANVEESIVEGVVSKLIKGRRWEVMWLLSRYPTSRAFLRERLQSTDPIKVKQMMRHSLRIRAESAMRNMRYDFMTRSECEEVLAIPEIEVGGRDLSDGPARPFPQVP